MAEEEKNETTDEQAEEAPVEDAPAAGPVAADDSPDSPEDGEPGEASATPPAEEASEEEAPSEEASAEEEAPPAEQGAKEAAEEAVEEAPPEDSEPEDDEAAGPVEADDSPDSPEDGEPEEPSATPPAEEASAKAEAPAADGGEAPEVLSPKQKRKLERSTFTGEAASQRSLEERVAERAERRRRAKEARRRVRARMRAAKGEPGTGTPPAEREPGSRKLRQGTVVSDKADKTITVVVEIARRHPAYEKIVRHSRKLHAHDESNEAREGDVVRIVETRPMSRTKRWRLAEIVERAPTR